jgi:hypothetical protein
MLNGSSTLGDSKTEMWQSGRSGEGRAGAECAFDKRSDPPRLAQTPRCSPSLLHWLAKPTHLLAGLLWCLPVVLPSKLPSVWLVLFLYCLLFWKLSLLGLTITHPPTLSSLATYLCYRWLAGTSPGLALAQHSGVWSC